MRDQVNTPARVGVMLAAGAIAAALLAAPAGAAGPASAPTVHSESCGAGLFAETIVPAAGFDPTTATDDQLIANGLAPRPASAADLAGWRRLVTGPVDRRTSCADLSPSHHLPITAGPAGTPRTWSGGPAAAVVTLTSPNWDGYLATAEAYDNVDGNWAVPPGTDRGDGVQRWSLQWAGLGRGNPGTEPLAQAGTGLITSGQGTVSYFAWWEVFPIDNTGIREIPLDISPGSHVYVHVTQSAGRASFHMLNRDTGRSQQFSFVDSRVHATAPQAEWILERAGFGSTGHHPLARTSQVQFSGARGGFSGTWLALASLPIDAVRMTSCNQSVQLAHVSGPSGSIFQATWDNWGVQESC
jgi:hypothetical protein